MKKYFLKYEEAATINYCFLFCLFLISNNNKIQYKNLHDLSTQIKNKCNYNISYSTISRILNNNDYETYFIYDKRINKITLKTNCKSGNKAACNKFIILSEKEIHFLLKQDNKLLNKYYLYIKYYCGYSYTKSIDTTAEQILSAIGYSISNRNKVSKYNKLLAESGFITIEKFKDNKGYKRNIYKVMNI